MCEAGAGLCVCGAGVKVKAALALSKNGKKDDGNLQESLFKKFFFFSFAIFDKSRQSWQYTVYNAMYVQQIVLNFQFCPATT